MVLRHQTGTRFDLDTGATNYHFQMARPTPSNCVVERQNSIPGEKVVSTYWNVSPFIDTTRSM